MIHSILNKTVMASQEDKMKDKDFLIKVYTSLSEIKKVIQTITQNDISDFQLSILGKRSFDDLNQGVKLDEMLRKISTQLNKTTGKPLQLGHFNNPEIGTLFIAGHLTNTFLQKVVDQKELASLPVGLSGIFRGIGIEIEHINRYIQELKNGNCLLIIRGKTKALEALSNI